MNIEQVIENGKFSVKEKRYAIMKTKRPLMNVFAAVCDGREITLIMEEYEAKHSLPRDDIIEYDDGWRIITFEMNLPFELVGFIAAVSQGLAQKGISIFSISAFSTDHILVKEERLDDAIKTLEELGFEQVKLEQAHA